MRLARWWRHLWFGTWTLRRRFEPELLAEIEAAIRRGERQHGGQVRWVAEARLPASYLRRNAAVRERALMIFGKERVWDTEENSGVLIYLNLAERDVEIIADRGVAHKVGASRWEAICSTMESRFSAGQWRAGALEGIEAVNAALATAIPRASGQLNELSDAPRLLP